MKSLSSRLVTSSDAACKSSVKQPEFSSFLNYPAISSQRAMGVMLKTSAVQFRGANLIRKKIPVTLGSFLLYQSSPQAVTICYYS